MPDAAYSEANSTSPIAVADNYSASTGELLAVAAPGLLQNDIPGTGGGNLIVVQSTPARYGTVKINSNGSFTYQSGMDFGGFDSFTYTIRNAHGLESTVMVTLMVTGGFPPPPSAVSPTGQNPGVYRLTFQDEFDGNSLDLSKWNTHLWYEDEPGLDNYEVSNGSLKIWFERKSDGSWVEHNRTLDTDGKFEQTYGFFEMEAKFPAGRGLWGSFWLYAHPGDDRPEIDIVEVYPGGGAASGWSDANYHPINYIMTMHKANADYTWHEIPFAIKLRDFAPYQSGVDLSAGFHKYAVKWEPSGITYYFDGQQIGPKYVATDDYFSKPMYVLLDLWIGGESGNPTSSTPTGISNSMEVNYVRVWQFN